METCTYQAVRHRPRLRIRPVCTERNSVLEKEETEKQHQFNVKGKREKRCCVHRVIATPKPPHCAGQYAACTFWRVRRGEKPSLQQQTTYYVVLEKEKKERI